MRRQYEVLSSTAGSFRCPKDDAILRFRFSFGISPTRLDRLLSSPLLKRMRVLDLSHKAFGDDQLLSLLDNRALTQLRQLNLSRSSITVGALPLMIEAPHLRTVTQLDLSSNELHQPSCLAHLARAFPALEHLGLAATKLSGDSIQHALLALDLPKLRTLDVRHCGAQAPHMLQALRASGRHPCLERVIA